jgi:hypothetical protein
MTASTRSSVLKSWLLVFHFEVAMRAKNFDQLASVVREEQVRQPVIRQLTSVEELCRSVDLACVFYFKQVFCLQRSAATTVLLRRFGWPAEMVIGAQILPFRSHAWVEVEGVVVNDKPYMHDLYHVLERC